MDANVHVCGCVITEAKEGTQYVSLSCVPVLHSLPEHIKGSERFKHKTTFV